MRVRCQHPIFEFHIIDVPSMDSLSVSVNEHTRLRSIYDIHMSDRIQFQGSLSSDIFICPFGFGIIRYPSKPYYFRIIGCGVS